ncbi:MAG: nuclear pore complex subunit [Flavobacteriales bacterium]|nr:MAG: nuclear pore complex subunit [Flavobacteriales bacterium]
MIKGSIVIDNYLKDLKIHKTPKTPEVDFNSTSGVFFISGVSVPENSQEFYEDVTKWIKSYVKKPAKNTTLIFKLTYISTSSIQFIYGLLMLLDKSAISSNIKVEWHYLEDDIDMKEMGEDLEDAISINFSLVEVKLG